MLLLAYKKLYDYGDSQELNEFLGFTTIEYSKKKK